jgi:hypothetical protein
MLTWSGDWLMQEHCTDIAFQDRHHILLDDIQRIGIGSTIIVDRVIGFNKMLFLSFTRSST